MILALCLFGLGHSPSADDKASQRNMTAQVVLRQSRPKQAYFFFRTTCDFNYREVGLASLRPFRGCRKKIERGVNCVKPSLSGTIFHTKCWGSCSGVK